MRKLIILSALLIGTVSVSNVFDAQSVEPKGVDHHDFSFHVPDWQENGQVDKGYYRETNNKYNAWMVNQTYSSENKPGENSGGTTTYWLERGDGTNVSPSRDTYNSKGEQYIKAKENAKNTTVYLTAQNNDFNNNDFQVKGYWDEETGKILG